MNLSLALQAPQAVKMEKQENHNISDSDAKQPCSVIREEQAEELARAGMGNNATRKCCTMAVLKSALTKQ